MARSPPGKDRADSVPAKDLLAFIDLKIQSITGLRMDRKLMRKLVGLYLRERAEVDDVVENTAASRPKGALTDDQEQELFWTFAAAFVSDYYSQVDKAFDAIQAVVDGAADGKIKNVLKLDPNDETSHNKFRYSTYRNLGNKCGFEERTPLPPLCEVIVKAAFPGPVKGGFTNFKWASDTSGSKRQRTEESLGELLEDAPLPHWTKITKK